MNKSKIVHIFLFVLGCLLALFYLSPMFILVNNSFKSLKEIYLNVLALPSKMNFINYTTALEKLNYGESFINSLCITVTSVILLILLSSMAAWVMVRFKTKASTMLFMFFTSALLIPFQCVMLPLVRFMDKLGLMNRPGIVFMYIGFGASMSLLLFHGFIKNIPEELDEAAAIDGANPFQIYYMIILPLLKPIAVTVAILNTMWIWNDFLLPSLMINKQGWQTLPLKTYSFFGQFSKRWDLATAGLIMVILPVIIFYLICQKHIVKSITDGAIK